METLRVGSHGHKVEYLQRLVNKAIYRERAEEMPLDVDGIFGPETQARVRSFQARHRPLAADGVANQPTWIALGLKIEAEHARVRRLGQPSRTSCWSAAASMIVGNMSVAQGRATLATGGGLQSTVDNLRVFAEGLGWQMPNHTPGVLELVGIVRRTPVWMSVGAGSSSHAVVLSGVYSDGETIGSGIMFRVHDPWPPGRGQVYGTFANPLTLHGADGRTWIPVSLEFLLLPR